MKMNIFAESEKTLLIILSCKFVIFTLYNILFIKRDNILVLYDLGSFHFIID